MGTVHGVYLKYVGISAISYAGHSFLNSSSGESQGNSTALQTLPAMYLGYSALLNGLIAGLFKLEWGMSMIGKNKETGQIPLWSYIIYAPFHIPTLLYTHIHIRFGRHKDAITGRYETVPVASEVTEGWWVGGCYGHELNKEWGGVIDLTVEFPESCRGRTKNYLSAPTWDGIPLPPAELEHAACFAVAARKDGDVLVHCAHGRGRSTTVMCACLVKEGLFSSWQESFEQIKKNRSVCKLNKRMRENLQAWQQEYVGLKKP